MVMRFVGAAAVAALLVSGSVAHADEMAELAKDPNKFIAVAAKLLKWHEPAEPLHIAGPIYFVGTQGLGIWLIKTSEGLILLDTGMPDSGSMIEASIRKLGFDPMDIKLVLANHPHVDHVGGHAYIKKLTGAEVVMIAEGVAELESGGKEDFFYKGYSGFEYEGVKVDRIVRDGEVVKLGDVALTALLTEGHCKGATSWLTTITDDGKAYTVLFPDGTGANPGYRLKVRPSYPGLFRDYEKTFSVLKTIEPDIWLGLHNETYGFAEKAARSAKEGAAAWVDPQGYTRFLLGQQGKFNDAIMSELAE